MNGAASQVITTDCFTASGIGYPGLPPLDARETTANDLTPESGKGSAAP